MKNLVYKCMGLKYFWSCGAAGSSFDVLLDGVG
jgi:hypothetical protein